MKVKNDHCSKFSNLSNRPRSIYQYSNMAPRLSGQNSIFGVVFFVSKSLLGIEGQKKLEKFAILTRKPRSHARILIYRTWPIGKKKPEKIRASTGFEPVWLHNSAGRASHRYRGGHGFESR